MGFVTLPIARQVDEYELQVFVISEGLELLLPGVHITAEAVNETDGFGISASRLILSLRVWRCNPYFIMYAYTIFNSNIL
jgi:hypothetical protein